VDEFAFRRHVFGCRDDAGGIDEDLVAKPDGRRIAVATVLDDLELRR
jgi:hypothetical protein